MASCIRLSRAGAAARLPYILILAVLLALAATALGGASARAAGGLVVTPQLVELDSKNRSQVLTLANRGSETETYRISVVNYRMDENGNLHPVDEPPTGEAFASALFRYAPRQITLEPGRPQTVRILYRRPAQLREGEYRSHLMFQQVPQARLEGATGRTGGGLSLQIQTVFGITIPVIVRHGTLHAQGALDRLRRLELDDGTPGVGLRIARSGNRSLRGDLVAMLDGAEVGRLNNVAVYLSTPHREVVLPLDAAALPRSSGEVRVEFRERPERGAAVLASGQLRFP